MHIPNAAWLIVALAVGIVALIAVLWPRRPRATDLGSVSDTWLAEHVTNGHRS